MDLILRSDQKMTEALGMSNNKYESLTKSVTGNKSVKWLSSLVLGYRRSFFLVANTHDFLCVEWDCPDLHKRG